MRTRLYNLRTNNGDFVKNVEAKSAKSAVKKLVKLFVNSCGVKIVTVSYSATLPNTKEQHYVASYWVGLSQPSQPVRARYDIETGENV